VRIRTMLGSALMATFFLTCASAVVRPKAAHKNHDKNRQQKIRLHEYRKSTVSPGAMARTAAGAGFAQLRHHPRAWGQGGRGYAKRFASGFGQRAVKGTIQYGVGTLRHEDPRSTKPLKPHGFRPKMKDAVRNTFTVRRFGHQKRGVAAGRISGAVGSGLVSQAWQPAAAAGIGAGLASGGIALGADLGINTAREFIPDKKKHHREQHGRRNRHRA